MSRNKLYLLYLLLFALGLGIARVIFLSQDGNQAEYKNPVLEINLLSSPITMAVKNHFSSLLQQPIAKKETEEPQLIKKTEVANPSPKKEDSPQPKPLTFAEMNQIYGPCAYVPVLFYHHVQTPEAAVAENSLSLTVDVAVFQEQMNYLQSQGYHPITMQQLIDFFDLGASLPSKPVILTIDDAYDDVFTDVFPILNTLGFPGTVFVPTGLINTPGYLTWSQAEEMRNYRSILLANHTVNHRAMTGSSTNDFPEIANADTQLAEHNLNHPKVFAYPYGPSTTNAINHLKELGYLLAFTTNPGQTMCKGQRLALPRTRVGAGSLSIYGL